MKGIILAGGTGSRLFPLTTVTNKHLLPVGKYPMIFHSISKLKQAEIADILIVTGKEHMGEVVNLLGSGSEMGVSFTYKVQDQAGGIAQALGLADQFVGNDQMVVILGDNVFEDDISIYVKKFLKQKQGAKILIQQVHDPNRYGVAELQGEHIVSIEEKPQKPKSNYAVTGIYMFDHTVFDIIKTLKPSGRGELEITDVNNAYIKRKELTFDILQGWWTDAGTHASLARANELAKDITLGEEFGKLRL
ncbi:NTP transferase domain-containing protein [Paenibacillus melissococcoides]|uniref:Glucose-1-phosphate thymidylyltransferase n=1 Tax=Paenibacillus melissococcoides TaxID=2912268 RepID=A0ABM9GAD1_9BACL|nr:MULTISPECIES: sugar phosphate nucleotidyltransferase [Paenibacillus]MEB9895329.1 sugar phosphate nucleotidyltransferase [Bacillus cereus]CAH8248960.1 NTP transferase domain-containing protein [Paenibacillus melissococcoides]CAH8720758.1 NTP transferase domain-containing protein [Paenibacillus melissococcoides]CAH8720898.1 NTP transferase domain-containing protein [Paenibacillus melissococcoides]GIO81640.1 glucose-1-phosphate thymidylyltransferase [Paenibacillus dendritiformis]